MNELWIINFDWFSDDGQYVAFGISGNGKKSRMVGSDVAVGWLDRSTGKGFVQDHFIDSKKSCSSTNEGVCQDILSPVAIIKISLGLHSGFITFFRLKFFKILAF